MKKAQMALVAALCVAGFAQAAEWSWHGGGTDYGTAARAPSVSNWNGSTGTGVMTYGMTFTVSADTLTNSAVIFSLTNSTTSNANTHTGNNGVKVTLGTDGKLTLSIGNTNGETFSSSYGTFTTTGAVNDGQSHVLGIAINNGGDVANGLKAGGIAFYLDGTQVWSGPGGDNDACHFYQSKLDNLVYGADGVTEDVWLAAAEGILSADQVVESEVIPEPTALALLALGVAGIALRRKVA